MGKRNFSFRKFGVVLLALSMLTTLSYSSVNNPLEISKEGRNIKISWAKVEGAKSYRIYHGPTHLSAQKAIATVKGDNYTHKSPNQGKYENHYRIVPLDAQGKTIDSEQTISFEKKLFGENMLFYDAKYDSGASVAEEINRIHDEEMFDSREGQFSSKRYSLNLKPGEYKDFGEMRIGFYTSFAGLGALPTDTKLNGSFIIPSPLRGGNATCTFWRSVENFELNPASASDTRSMFRWAVSQAAPARRLSVNIRTQFDWNGEPGMNTPWASGGFLSDCRFTDRIGSPNQQQWYSRSCHFGHSTFSGDNWNRVTQGVTGHPYVSNWETGGARTNIETVPVVREKPFLYLEGEVYKVFLPALRHNSSGITWNDETGDRGKGSSLDIEKDFYIAKPGDTAEQINAQINKGKHIFFTPGWYEMETPLHVTRANTILLGSGYATLFPAENNREGAILIDDVPGVTVASLMIDAHFDSKYLIRCGEWGANKDHSDNPTFLSDVFIRVGGYKSTPVNADVSVQVNSNNVIGDHLWIWRADHGSGVSWDTNRGDYGLVVSGNDVSMYGLFVEHYQKYQTLWLGENGKTFFYQNELPYDPPMQSAWMSHHGTVNGYSAYKVGNKVNNHYAIGIGCYGVFNRQQQGVFVSLANAVEVPNKPGITVKHVITTELGGRGGTSNIVNGTGEGVGYTADGSLVTNIAAARRLVSYHNGVGIVRPAEGNTNLTQQGINPTDETFDLPK